MMAAALWVLTIASSGGWGEGSLSLQSAPCNNNSNSDALVFHSASTSNNAIPLIIIMVVLRHMAGHAEAVST